MDSLRSVDDECFQPVLLTDKLSDEGSRRGSSGSSCLTGCNHNACSRIFSNENEATAIKAVGGSKRRNVLHCMTNSELAAE